MKTETKTTPISPTAPDAAATIVVHSDYAHRYRAGQVHNQKRLLLPGSQDIVAELAKRPRKANRLVIISHPELLASYCEKEFGKKVCQPAIVKMEMDGKETGQAQMVLPTIVFGSDPNNPGDMSKKRMSGIINRIHTFASREVGHGVSIRDDRGELIHGN